MLVHVPEGHNYNDHSVDSNPESIVLEDPATFAARAANTPEPEPDSEPTPTPEPQPAAQADTSQTTKPAQAQSGTKTSTSTQTRTSSASLPRTGDAGATMPALVAALGLAAIAVSLRLRKNEMHR